MAMDIITNPKDFQERCLSLRGRGLTTALVPTMGYFHQGHLSLMDYARENADRVMVSLFVNPSQFGPGEDLDKYPHDLKRDTKLAEQHGVDILFAPKAGTMYEEDHATWVEVPELAKHLCGKSRPVHFRGVATIVTKLLMLSMPSLAVFGEKDWQQLAIIKRMVRDLNIPVRIEGRPIFREDDGLAMSSRNVYLTGEERAQAPAIRKGLLKIRDLAAAGEKNAKTLIQTLEKIYSETLPLGRTDYISVVDSESIQPVDEINGKTLIAVAVFMGKARLIDNCLLEV